MLPKENINEVFPGRPKQTPKKNIYEVSPGRPKQTPLHLA